MRKALSGLAIVAILGSVVLMTTPVSGGVGSFAPPTFVAVEKETIAALDLSTGDPVQGEFNPARVDKISFGAHVNGIFASSDPLCYGVMREPISGFPTKGSDFFAMGTGLISSINKAND
ncbi:MAG: hypothetical protein EXR53_04620, partial [Dehalococcoidia bacterium]|nr:hypothetical protein [Dehalococcoidia bacterium]